MEAFELILAAVALVTVRWWFPAVRDFLREVWAAGEPTDDPEIRAPRQRATSRQAFVRPGEIPLRRRNLARKGRWEGGFGRRGL